MNEAKQDKLQEIAKYSKEEIIEALGRKYTPEWELDGLLANLEYIRRTKAIEEHRKAVDEETAAFKAVIGWRKEVIDKYGDGVSVKCTQLPAEERKRGVTLENAWFLAQKKEKRLDAKVSKLLGC